MRQRSPAVRNPCQVALGALLCTLVFARVASGNGAGPDALAAPELRCHGNEPSWALQILDGSARFSGLFQIEARLTLEGSYAHLPFHGAHVWRGRSTPEGADLVAFIREASCGDTMSDETYPYTATVSAPDGKLLAGCCRGGPLPARPEGSGPAPPSRSALEECYAQTETRLDVGPCLERKFAEAEQDLQQVRERRRAQMRELDAVTSSDAGAERAFLVAQDAFLAFRERNCRWRSAELASGTGAGDVYRACLVDATIRRTEELLEGGGPVPRSR